MRTLAFFCILALTILLACSKSSDSGGGGNGNPDCNATPKKFTEVNPIFQSSCTAAGCHDAASINGPGPLLTYTQLFNARGSIRVVISNGTMPKNGSLTTAQKNSIICWIDSGAPNN